MRDYDLEPPFDPYEDAPPAGSTPVPDVPGTFPQRGESSDGSGGSGGSDGSASWAPIDLGPYLDGTHVSPVPTLMPRADGVCVLYRGLTHSFHGESESGKTLIVELEVVRLIGCGERVLFIDFESDAGLIVERLLEFGAQPDEIRKFLTYVRPEVRPDTTTQDLNAWLDLLRGRYALAVIDGVTDALGMFGYSTKDNDDVTTWARQLPRRIADRTGAAVVLIDHVTKDGESRGRFAIGGQAKLSSLTGAAFTVEVVRPLGRGLRGVVVLRVAKDRPGFIRGHAGPMRARDRTQEVARVVIDSTGPVPTWTVEPYHGHDADPDAPATRWRPTALMEAVSAALEAATEPLSFRKLDEAVKGKADHKRTAIAELLTAGFIAIAPGPRNAMLHRSVTPYLQAEDPQSDQFERRDTVDPSTTTESAGNECVTVSRTSTWIRDTHTQPPSTVSGTHSGHSRDTVEHRDLCRGCGQALDDVDGTGLHPGCSEAVAG